MVFDDAIDIRLLQVAMYLDDAELEAVLLESIREDLRFHLRAKKRMSGRSHQEMIDKFWSQLKLDLTDDDETAYCAELVSNRRGAFSSPGALFRRTTASPDPAHELELEGLDLILAHQDGSKNREPDGPYGPGIEVKFDEDVKELPKRLFIENDCLNNVLVGEKCPRPGEPWEFYVFGHRDAPDGPRVFVVVVGATHEEARERLDRFSNRDDVTVLESAEDDDHDDS